MAALKNVTLLKLSFHTWDQKQLTLRQRSNCSFQSEGKDLPTGNSQDIPQLPWRQSDNVQGSDEATGGWTPKSLTTPQNAATVTRAFPSEPVVSPGHDRPESLADAQQVLKLLGDLQVACESLERVLKNEAQALQRRQKGPSSDRGIVSTGWTGGRHFTTAITLEHVQVAQDRVVAIGMLAKDAQLEEQRLHSMIREVENGAMRLADVRLPELVGPILEQLQGILASIRTANMESITLAAKNMRAPPTLPPRPLAPPPLHLAGQIVAMSRLKQEIASEEEASRSRVLALTNS